MAMAGRWIWRIIIDLHIYVKKRPPHISGAELKPWAGTTD